MFLLQMAGYPGSGKSTLSKKIAKTTGAIVIDKDVIKSSLIVSDVPEKLLAPAAHNILFELAKFYLKMKLDVILDCPCYYELTVNRGTDIADNCEARYKYIECRVEDYSILEKRINTRDILPSQFRTASYEPFKNSIDKSVRPKDGNYLIIDTSTEDSYDFDSIQKYLKHNEDIRSLTAH